MAGSAKNQQLTRIVVVPGADDRAALSKCGNYSDWVPGAAAVFVLVIPKAGGKQVDVGRLAENMLAPPTRSDWPPAR